MKKVKLHDFFNFPVKWCPLFGTLPLYHLSDSVDAANDIIRQARGLIRSDPYFGFSDPSLYSSQIFFSSWPEPAEVETITNKPQAGEAVKAARTIWGLSFHIHQYALTDYRTKHIQTAETIDKAWEEAIQRAYLGARGEGRPLHDMVAGDFILAVLAINEAWSSLYDIFEDKNHEDSPNVLKRLLIAQWLLFRANNIRNEYRLNALQSHISFLRQQEKLLHELKRKGADTANERKRSRGERLHIALKDEMKDIAKENKALSSVNGFVNRIIKREKSKRLKNKNLKDMLPGSDRGVSRYVEYILEECWEKPCKWCQERTMK